MTTTTSTIQSQLVDSLTVSQCNVLRLVLHSEGSMDALRRSPACRDHPGRTRNAACALPGMGRTAELFTV